MRRFTEVSFFVRALSAALAFIVAAAVLFLPLWGTDNGGAGSAVYAGEAADGTVGEMLVSFENSPDYGDTPSGWAKADVETAVSEGLVPGELQCDYQKPITRAEMARLIPAYIVWHFSGDATFEDYCEAYENGGALSRSYPRGQENLSYAENVFSDTNDYTVNRLYEMGLISGFEDGSFRPDAPISRQDAATILYRAMDRFIEEFAETSYGTEYIRNVLLPERFRDAGSIGTWADLHIGRMVVLGCMEGVEEDRFAPQELISREQAIITVLRMTRSDSMGGQLLEYREKDRFETIPAADCTRIEITDLATGRSVSVSDAGVISGLLENLSSFEGYYTGVSPTKWTGGYRLSVFSRGASGSEWKTSIFVNETGTVIDADASLTDVADDAESGPMTYRAFSMAKQFNAYGSDGGGTVGVDVDSVRSLIEAA